MIRRAVSSTLAVAVCLAGASAGAARPLTPAPARGLSYADAVIDLDARDAAVAAWVVEARRSVRTQVRIRPRARTGFGPVQDLGPGRVAAVRIGGAPRRVLVVVRRGGRLVALVRTGVRWRPEPLPRAAGGTVRAAEWAGRRAVAVTGTARRVRVVVRGGDGRWRTGGLIEIPGTRATVVGVAEGSGAVIAAWVTRVGPTVRVHASVWTLGTGRWSVPDTLFTAEGALPQVLSAHVNRRGDAAVHLAPGRGGFGYGPGGGAFQVAARRAGTARWVLSPGTPAARVALAPDGRIVAAHGEPGPGQDGTTFGDVVRVVAARWVPGGDWSPPVAVAEERTDDAGGFDEVTGVAVTATGRAAVSWTRDPGPAPDDHYGALERSAAGPFARRRLLGSLHGAITPAPGGRTAAALHVSDPTGRGVPELVTLP